MAYIQARPTVHNGVQMRSRLEAAYAAHLDEGGMKWAYEPRCYSSAKGQYLPDFEILDPHGFIEVKPTRADAITGLERMHVILSTDPSAALAATYPAGWSDGYYGWTMVQCLPSRPCGGPSCPRQPVEWPLSDAMGGTGLHATIMRCPRCTVDYFALRPVDPKSPAYLTQRSPMDAYLYFHCEGCGHYIGLHFAHHKGQTIASMHDLGTGSSDDPVRHPTPRVSGIEQLTRDGVPPPPRPRHHRASPRPESKR